VETPNLETVHKKGTIEEAMRETRSVIYDGKEYETTIYERSELPATASFDGPAVIEGKESTVVVHPDQQVEVDIDGNLIVETGGEH
jgi:N-methylhydantoinase A